MRGPRARRRTRACASCRSATKGTASARDERRSSRRGPGGMLSVAGGKLTTYRRIALDALERCADDLGLRRARPAPWPLPGATGLAAAPLPVELEPDVAHAPPSPLRQPRRRASSRLAADDPSLLERLHPGRAGHRGAGRLRGPHEWATTVDDVLLRRTTVGWRGLDDSATRARVAALVAASGT